MPTLNQPRMRLFFKTSLKPKNPHTNEILGARFVTMADKTDKLQQRKKEWYSRPAVVFSLFK